MEGEIRCTRTVHATVVPTTCTSRITPTVINKRQKLTLVVRIAAHAFFFFLRCCLGTLFVSEGGREGSKKEKMNQKSSICINSIPLFFARLVTLPTSYTLYMLPPVLFRCRYSRHRRCYHHHLHDDNDCIDTVVDDSNGCHRHQQRHTSRACSSSRRRCSKRRRRRRRHHHHHHQRKKAGSAALSLSLIRVFLFLVSTIVFITILVLPGFLPEKVYTTTGHNHRNTISIRHQGKGKRRSNKKDKPGFQVTKKTERFLP